VAQVIAEPMRGAPDYAAVAIEVEQIDDHRQPAFRVEAGADRRWLDESERDALGQRIRALTELQQPDRAAAGQTPNRSGGPRSQREAGNAGGQALMTRRRRRRSWGAGGLAEEIRGLPSAPAP
jgi:hypothetical protein